MADGYELERNVVPALGNFVSGLRDPLRTFGAKQIREKALASRDLALAARQVPRTAAGLFVIDGSPRWRAWLRGKGVKSHFTFASGEDRTLRGNRFPSERAPE